MSYLAVSFLRFFSRKLVASIRILVLTIPMCQFVGYAHAGEIEVAWESVAMAEGYKLYYGFESRSYDFTIDVGLNLQHKISDLEDNTLYYFAVTAYNGDGESDLSKEISTRSIANTGELLLGNSQVFSETSTSANRRAVPYTMPEDGYLLSISMYHNGGSGKMMLGLYADDGLGNPGNLLAVTDETDVNSTEGWQSIELNTPVYVPAGTPIWLAWVYENNPGVRYQEGPSGRAKSDEIWDGSMPYAYGPSSIDNYVYSIYATFLPESAILEETVGNTEVFSMVATVGERRAMPYMMPEDGVVQSISMYHHGGSGKMLLGLYADNGLGNPGTQLALTDESDVSAVDGWQTIKLIEPVLVPAGSRIWLAWIYEKSTGLRYKVGSPGRIKANEFWGTGMPVDFGPGSSTNYIYSIYATYTPENY